MSTQTRTRKLRIGRGSAGILMTPEEFDAITRYDDRYGYELINGVLVVTAIPSEGEASPNDELGHWLRSYKESHPQGKALDLTLPERYILTRNRRKADRVLWAGLGRLPDPEVDLPTIAVEFVSKAKRDVQRDYEEKRREYEEARIQEYWLIDRFRRIMTVFRNRPGLPRVEVIPENGVYRTDSLPGFELPLAKLFQLSDPWTQPRQSRRGRER